MREEAGLWDEDWEQSEPEPAPTRMGRKAEERLSVGPASGTRATLRSLVGRRIPSRARAAEELQSYLRMAYSTEPVKAPARPQRVHLSTRLGLLVGGLLVLVGLVFAAFSLLSAPEVQSREASGGEVAGAAPSGNSELAQQALEKVAVRDPSRSGTAGSGAGSRAGAGRAGGIGGGAGGAAGDGGAGGGSAELTVHVTGAVVSPGLYHLPAGSRVWDAIQAAGGGSDDADLEQLNLARPIGDGEQIRIPHHGEDASQWAGAGGVAGGAGSTGAGSAGGAPDGIGGAGAAGGGAGLVNINQADAAALEALPGIGPALAARIVQYREAHGPFASVDDLRSVPGIGNAKLEGLRDAATV